MTTPRKESPKREIGPRVSDRKRKGPRIAGNEFARVVIDRVKAIKRRLKTTSRSDWQRLTRTTFAERIGLTDDGLRRRLRKAKPVPFTAEELCAICDTFGVRAEYLLRGEEPMLHADLMDDMILAITDAVIASPASTLSSNALGTVVLDQFGKSLHRHLAQVVATAMDQETEWVVSYLPGPDDLLLAIERGTADAVTTNVDHRVNDRLFANACVRDAVSDSIHRSTPTPDVPDPFFKSAADGLVDGTVIDLKKPSRQSRRR